MRLALVEAPGEEPISLAEARSHLRLSSDQTSENGLVLGMITAARREAERATGRAFVTQTWRGKLDAFPAGGVIELPLPPLQSVSSITYVDADGATQTVSSSDYVVDTNGVMGRVYPAYLESWPVPRAQRDAVTVQFVVGYGAADDVPAEFKAWMLTRVADLFDAYRTGTVTGTIATRLPGIDSLLLGDRVGL